MTQTVPAALVAPSKPGLTVGYLIRALNGTIATAFTTTNVADATDAASVITQLNALLTRMRNLGLIAT